MKAFFVLCFAVVAFEAINAQVIRSLAPGIISNGGCGCGCNNIAPVLAPIAPCPNIIAPPPCSTNIIAPVPPCSCSTNVIQAPVYSDIISLPYTSGIISSGSNIIATSPISSNLIAPSPISSTIIAQQPSVAANLADTLSLLTVSSLLAETLPFSSNVIMAPPCGLYGGYNGYYY